MPTTADLVREMIEEMVERVWEQGGDPVHGSERVEALWMEVQVHLRSADLCELLGKYEDMTSHFNVVNRLLEKIMMELSE